MLNAFHRHRPRRTRAGTSGSPGGRTTADPVVTGVADPLSDLEGHEALDGCDAYVVLVADPVTGALDSYGPLPGPEALAEAERRRRDLDRGDLADVAVEVVRHHHRT